MVYAEINEDKVCFSILSTPNKIEKPTMIEVDSYDTSYLGKTYDNGVWIDPPEPEPIPEIMSETDEAILDTQANVEYLVALKEMEMML